MNNSWTRMADFIGQGRFNPTGFVINDKAYVGTGALGAQLYRDFYEFSLESHEEGWSILHIQEILHGCFAGASASL